MSDPSLTIRIPDEEAEFKKDLKYLDRKILQIKQTLMYLESKDCRNCLLPETINEHRHDATANFRIVINAKQELLEKYKSYQNLTNQKDNNVSGDSSK